MKLGATVLTHPVIEALGNLHDNVGNIPALENDLFLIQAELSKDAILIRAQEQTILKQEETIIYQAHRLEGQNETIRHMEHDLARVQMQHSTLLDNFRIEQGRSLIQRIVRKLYDVKA